MHFFCSGIMKPSSSYKRNFMIWGDHSSILNSGYMLYTIKVIFSKSIFYTDQEFFAKSGRHMNIQSIVEQPEIYIVAKCADTIAEKLSYVDIRREDVLEKKAPLIIDDVTLTDNLRFFQGILVLHHELFLKRLKVLK